MNYLAHAYLSLNTPGVITGNMISDFVKGSRQYELPAAILRGVKLHRAIDQFTDSHESTRFVKGIFHPRYRLYAGAFSDIVYDHFLANDDALFKEEEGMMKLNETTCRDLEENTVWLPEKFLPVFSSMKKNNWLTLYGQDWAMKKSFEGLVKRASYLEEADSAFELFMTHKQVIREAYSHFMPELLAFNSLMFEEIIGAV